MIGDLLQVLVLLLILVVYFRYARRAEDKLYLVFAALSTATLMISTIYFLTHSMLREGMRVPFAANDIADFGTFLMISTALRSAVGTAKGRFRGVTIGAAAFAAANICLWIAWSGEWVRDIFGGLSFAYFICVCIRSIYLTQAMNRWERCAMWALSICMVAVETAALLSPAGLQDTLEAVDTVLLALGQALLLTRALLAFRTGKSVDAVMSLCYTAFCWNGISMYMSAGLAYTVFSNLMTMYALLMLLAAGKKVRAA